MKKFLSLALVVGALLLMTSTANAWGRRCGGRSCGSYGGCGTVYYGAPSCGTVYYSQPVTYGQPVYYNSCGQGYCGRVVYYSQPTYTQPYTYPAPSIQGTGGTILTPADQPKKITLPAPSSIDK